MTFWKQRNKRLNSVVVFLFSNANKLKRMRITIPFDCVHKYWQSSVERMGADVCLQLCGRRFCCRCCLILNMHSMFNSMYVYEMKFNRQIRTGWQVHIKFTAKHTCLGVKQKISIIKFVCLSDFAFSIPSSLGLSCALCILRSQINKRVCHTCNATQTPCIGQTAVNSHTVDGSQQTENIFSLSISSNSI